MQVLKERLHALSERQERQKEEIKKYKSTAFYESVKTSSEGNFIQSEIYCDGGLVKIEAESQAELFLNGVPVIQGEYFYLNEGEYLLKGQTLSDEGTIIKIVVTGNVKEASRAKTKGVNFNDASYILFERDNEFDLYKYYDEVFSLLKSEKGEKADIVKGDGLYYALLKEGGVTLQKFSDENFITVGEFECEDFLCDYSQKLTLYIVKKGILYVYEQGEEGFTECKTSIKTDKLYAVRGEKIVYRDLQGKVRLNFGISRERK